MTSITGRLLHYVFKVADRKLTAHFYRNILGMKVLRHEEFTEGCLAACNGPYTNRWSKTMIGYGPEDDHCVIELTYNYSVKTYEKGNDFVGISIKSREALERARKDGWPVLPGNVLEAPGGYKFYIVDEPQPVDKDPVEKIILACSDLGNSIEYWNKLLGLKVFKQTEKSVELGFDENKPTLELQQIDEPINRATAYGRIAFSIPHDQQPEIDNRIQQANETILTPLISLDTPDKATVRVIILADKDGHEICFVDDEAFKQLSQVDPEGDRLLNKYIEQDKS